MRRLLIAAAVILVAGAFGSEPAPAATTAALDACVTTTLSTTGSLASADIETVIGNGIGDNCVYDPGVDQISYGVTGVAHYTPPQWFVARDADIPLGTHVGEISLGATFGILNNPCANFLTVDANLMDASTDFSDTIDGLPPGTPDHLRPFREDADSNGLPDGADHFPAFLLDMALSNGWDTDGLVARLFGATTIPPLLNQTLIWDLLVFEPGSPITTGVPSDPRQGYLTLLILNDQYPGSPEEFVSDFCAPAVLDWTLLGEADGHTFRRNPANGNYNFTLFAGFRPDADEDSFENDLDTCPFAPNSGNSHASPDPGDEDHDGLDLVCDPDPNTGQGTSCVGIAMSDQDGDCWMNRADNCPLADNDNQGDVDADGIGDACDPDPSEVNGIPYTTCDTQLVSIGAGGDLPDDPLTMVPCVASTGAAAGDLDCDGKIDGFDALQGLLFFDFPPAEEPDCFGTAWQIDCVESWHIPELMAVLTYLADRRIPILKLYPCPSPVP